MLISPVDSFKRHVFYFQEGSITQVACCPHDEDFIAVATRLEMK